MVLLLCRSRQFEARIAATRRQGAPRSRGAARTVSSPGARGALSGRHPGFCAPLASIFGSAHKSLVSFSVNQLRFAPVSRGGQRS